MVFLFRQPEMKKQKFLVHTQTERPDNTRNFYPCVINKTDITFPNEDLILLNVCMSVSKRSTVSDT